jgi:hypothetical protein
LCWDGVIGHSGCNPRCATRSLMKPLSNGRCIATRTAPRLPVFSSTHPGAAHRGSRIRGFATSSLPYRILLDLFNCYVTLVRTPLVAPHLGTPWLHAVVTVPV